MTYSETADLASQVTVVIVPREKFSYGARSLASILEHTPPGVPFVYVDGGKSDEIAAMLEAAAATNPSTYIKIDKFISPNTARNVAFTHVQTPYAAFVDNDVFVQPQWLDAMVACAEQSGAAIVGPLTLINIKGKETVHLTGGLAHIVEENGVRRCVEVQRDSGAKIADGMARETSPTEAAEYHTMLVSSEFLRRTGPLDEALLSVNDHVDLCLLAAQHGEPVMFCKESVVSYFATDDLTAEDRAYYRVRWSEAWNTSSARHFADKWGLSHAGNAEVLGFARVHRFRGLKIARSSSAGPAKNRKLRLQRAVERVTNVVYLAVAGNSIRADGKNAHVRRFAGPNQSATLRAAAPEPV